MGKKLTFFLILVCIGLAAIVVKFKIQADKQGPEITFHNTDLVYNQTTTKEELLADVTAMDEEEGDVSSLLLVENIYEISDEQVVVVYVARDSKNNITKLKRTLNCGEKMSEESADNEEISDTEKNVSEEIPEPTPEPTPAETEAERIRREQLALADEMAANMPKIYLTDYWIEVPIGTTIDAISYVSEIKDDVDSTEELWKKIQLHDASGNHVDAALNFTSAGTYEYIFFVVDSQGNASNNAVLMVVVK